MPKPQEDRLKKRFVSDVDDVEIESISKSTGMTLYVSLNGKTIVVRARAESDGIIGDLVEEVSPGESAFGLTYDELFDNLGELKI